VTARLATHPDVAARAAEVRDRLVAAGVEVESIATGDRVGDRPFERSLDRDGHERWHGPFHVDPLAAVRERSVDLALVGLGALRGTAADGLTLVAVLPREDPRDVVVAVGRGPAPLRSLPAGARVGVHGARRRALLLAHRPDLVPVDIDADPDAQDLRAASLDAAVLASVFAREIRLTGRVGELLDARSWLPEPGQGAVALVARHPIAEVTALDHLPTRTALRAELALLDTLDAPPDAAIGSLAQPSGRMVRLWAAMMSLDGTRFVRSDLTAPLDEPELLGASVARQLRNRAAGVLLSTTS
jgi:hydroxymethylbilane synthase